MRTPLPRRAPEPFFRTISAPGLLAFPALLLAFCLTGLALFGCAPSSSSSAPPAAEVFFIDVGQGDAALLRAPDGRAYLVDAGPRPDSLLRFLRSRKVGRIEALFLTHPDFDHYGAAPKLLAEVPVGRVFLPAKDDPDSTWLSFRRSLAASAPVPASWPSAASGAAAPPTDTLYLGDTLDLGAGMGLRVLWPPRQSDFAGNENSLVFRLSFKGRHVLFTGDIGFTAEAALLATGPRLRCDYLKVAHHGSKFSSSLPFLEAAAPFYAVLSTGPNSYGHPHPEALAALSALLRDPARILRTDERGSIGIVWREDGGEEIVFGR